MEINSPPPCPNTVTVRRNPSRRARATPLATPQTFNLSEIPPFPNDDVLAEDTPQTLTSLPESETDRKIKVFLRIRPILSPSQAPKVRAKSVWPQNPSKKNIAGGAKFLKKKKISNLCLTANDSHSVTLSTPLDLQESKRSKSETYGGFSHVFNSDSSQVEVYEKMVKPIVEDFLKGKSGMLAALGPSGSGKTHTVFGSPRDPGMVSLALQHIFKGTEPHGNKASRSFHMSVFEIYTERGKAEKLLDLLRDGGELSMQQSSVKGLQQVVISNVEEAESFIAQSVLKRATAMTNTNSQSSRSQCIINIRDIPQKCKGVVNPKSGAVLTIIDLAGAEREKRTGNQGTRLLESNFINNTLMVFGLCLRSLLEHQKNPKKPLQKNFQNSMLTRYLREYLEGKKRMTLILTAKSEDEDYLDTSYLLRQASPYMQIKYNEVEPTNMVSKKRHYQASSAMDFAKPSPASEHLKRMRFVSSEHTVQNDEKSVAEVNTSKKDASTECKLDASSCVSFKPDCDSQTQSERSHIIMRNFAKVLWSVLKQSNSKLKAAEMEIQSLKESIGYEKKKYLVLKKEFNEFKACSTWTEGGKVKVKDGVVDPALNIINYDDNTLNFQPAVTAGHSDVANAFELHGENSSIDNCQIIESKDDKTNDVLTCHEAGICCLEESKGFILSPPQSRGITRRDSCSSVEQDKELDWEQEGTFYVQASSKPSRLDQSDGESTLDSSCTQLDSEKSDREVQASASKPAHHNALEVEAVNEIPNETFHVQESSEPRIDQPDEEPALGTSCTELDSGKSDKEGSTSSSKSEVEAVNKISSELLVSSSITKSEILDPSSTKDVSSTKTCDIVGDSSGVSSNKPSKPKRTLMPSSSLLSRDFTFDPVDETEKLKGNKGTRKLAADDMKSKGSITLLHLLKGKSNLRGH